MQDIEKFIESSKKGAVLFSLGTNVRSSLMDLEKQKMLLDAFEQFPNYNFIWKFEDKTIDLELPKNVMIRPWVPQSDILAHPKIKAFFSHSGNLNDVFVYKAFLCHLIIRILYKFGTCVKVRSD